MLVIKFYLSEFNLNIMKIAYIELKCVNMLRKPTKSLFVFEKLFVGKIHNIIAVKTIFTVLCWFDILLYILDPANYRGKFAKSFKQFVYQLEIFLAIIYLVQGVLYNLELHT